LTRRAELSLFGLSLLCRPVALATFERTPPAAALEIRVVLAAFPAVLHPSPAAGSRLEDRRVGMVFAIFERTPPAPLETPVVLAASPAVSVGVLFAIFELTPLRVAVEILVGLAASRAASDR
jgi:hypothetical protein